MIWKILSATAAIFILTIGYFSFVPADAGVLNNIDAAFGSLAPNSGGISVAGISVNAFQGFIIGIVVAVLAVVLYLFAASQADESDEGVLS